jgi:DNA-binding NarL/FixJ family response regulator
LKTIKKLGFSVRAVWNGQEALDYLTDPANVKPDIVLMDVQMPVLDGVSFYTLVVSLHHSLQSCCPLGLHDDGRQLSTSPGWHATTHGALDKVS